MMHDNSIPSNRDGNHSSPSHKSRSRGASSDMSSAAILRRLEIVDELRELADDLQNAKRMGPLDRKVSEH
jgi:hypothetical protein